MKVVPFHVLAITRTAVAESPSNARRPPAIAIVQLDKNIEL
jgi:hypothetical protein